MRFGETLRYMVKRGTNGVSIPRLDAAIGTAYANMVPPLDSNADADFSLAYLACEMAKMRPISALPVHVYTKTSDGNREEAKNDVGFRLQYLLRSRWNPLVPSDVGLRWIMYTKDTKGNAYVRVKWDETGRFPVNLYPLPLGVVEYWDQASETVSYGYAGDDMTPEGYYTDKEIIVFTSPLTDADGVHGRSLAEAAARNVGLSIDIEEFYSRLLNNGSHMPLWLETEDRLSPNDRKDLEESLTNTRGILNAGVLRIFDKGLKLKQSGFTMTDIDLSKQQTWILEQMCRVCGVPPQEVYDLSRSTYSNVNQSSIQFAQKTLMPECAQLESAFNCVLRAAGEFKTYVKFDINGLLRGDFADRMDAYRIGIYAGFYTRNDVREYEDMNKLAGLDAPLIPVNYYIVDENGDVINPVPPAISGNDSQGGVYQPDAEDQKDIQSAQDNPVIRDARQRIIKRAQSSNNYKSTYRFARMVLEPYELACIQAGKDFDIEEEIENLIGGYFDD